MSRYPTDSHDLLVWRLNESGPPFLNSGTEGMAGDLVQVGTVTPGVPAIWGNGVQFPGTAGNYLRTGDTSLAELTTLSFCAWVYPTGVINDGQGGTIVQKQIKDLGGSGPAANGSVGLIFCGFSSYYWRQQPVLRFTRGGQPSSFDIWHSNGSSGSTIIEWREWSQWYLISGTFGRQSNPAYDTRVLYLNGIPMATRWDTYGEGINWGNHGPWMIGNNTISGNGFVGIIGEVRVSDVERPPTYWRDYYAAGVESLPAEEYSIDPTKPRSMLPIADA